MSIIHGSGSHDILASPASALVLSNASFPPQLPMRRSLGTGGLEALSTRPQRSRKMWREEKHGRPAHPAGSSHLLPLIRMQLPFAKGPPINSIHKHYWPLLDHPFAVYSRTGYANSEPTKTRRHTPKHPSQGYTSEGALMPVEHCVESGHLVHAHLGHVEHLGDLNARKHERKTIR